MVPDLQSHRNLILSGTTRSRQYYESTMVLRFFPLYHFLKCLLPFATLFLFEKTKQSTRSGGTGAGCVRPWLTRDKSRLGLQGISQVSRRSEVGNHKSRTLSTQLSSGTSAGTLRVSTSPYVNYQAEAGTDIFLVKKVWKIDPHVSNLRSR